MAVLEQNAKELTAPFYWYGENPRTDEGEPSGGTVCFVRTGETLLGVSAAHVHRACVEFLESTPGPSCQIGGHSFSPADRIIDIDDVVDLMTVQPLGSPSYRCRRLRSLTDVLATHLRRHRGRLCRRMALVDDGRLHSRVHALLH